MSAVLETRGLGHDYGSRKALDDVSLTLAPGEIVALLGPNGGGKSTLFRILSTVMDASRGEATIAGHDVRRAPADVRQALGVTFQAPSLDRKLTVRENLIHQGHLYGLRGPDLAKRVQVMLEAFGLTDRAGDYVETLSGGLARRADVAKSVLHRPRLLLLDEPSTGLDPAARRDLLRLLQRTRDESGTTCFLATHLFEEAEVCDRVAILDRGRLVALGRPADLVREVGGEVVKLTSDDPEGLAVAIRERFAMEAVVADGEVRMEREDGAALLTPLLAAFPDRILSATVARPGLSDVFFRRAGRAFEEGSDA
ncbi:MAG: ATP-binding cassette domain-containing protein [Gemmatimonadetes bacterium]|nr:ATP-binding cassette domain-containing protein [Gemmatimonadota bacterium]